MSSNDPIPAVGATADDGRSAAADEAHVQRIDRLFREHNQSLVSVLRARLQSQQDATEVAQEAYVRLLQLGDARAISFLRGFLFRTALNLAADRLKQRRRRGRLDELVFFEPPDGPVSPEREVAAKQEYELFRRAVEELPAKCRLAFEITQFDGLSLQEAAVRMNLTKRMVQLYIVRALEHCRSRLKAASLLPRRST